MNLKIRAVKTKWNRRDHVCSHCGGKTTTVYVVTGHDHTDSSITTCSCGAGTSIQKEWESNHYARDACPVEYLDTTLGIK